MPKVQLPSLLLALGYHSHALALVDAYLSTYPDDPALLAVGARSAFHCGDWNRCIRWASSWHKLRSRTVEPLLLTIVVHWLLQELEKARAAVSSLQALDNKILYAVCQQMQWYMEGRDYFSLYIAPTNAREKRAFHNAVMKVLRLVVISKNLGLLSKLLPILSPEEDLDAWLQLGLYYYQYGYAQLAWLELRDCEERGKATFESLHVLGKLALARQEFALAIDYLQRALQTKPAHIETRLLLAKACQRRAEQLIDEGMRLYPDAALWQKSRPNGSLIRQNRSRQ